MTSQLEIPERAVRLQWTNQESPLSRFLPVRVTTETETVLLTQGERFKLSSGRIRFTVEPPGSDAINEVTVEERASVILLSSESLSGEAFLGTTRDKTSAGSI